MPRRSRSRLTYSKRGRGHDGRGARGRGRGGWVKWEPKPSSSEESSSGYVSHADADVADIPDLQPTTADALDSLEGGESTEQEIFVPVGHDHDYLSSLTVGAEEEVGGIHSLLLSAVPETKLKIEFLLPANWLCRSIEGGFDLYMLSLEDETAIQRSIKVDYPGSVAISVHRKKLSASVVSEIMSKAGSAQTLKSDVYSVHKFCDWVARIVAQVRLLDICVGCDYSEYRKFWNIGKLGCVDKNPYGETRYKETFRSHNCAMLLNPRKWRCNSCNNLGDRLRRRLKNHQDGEYKKHTNNAHLLPEEAKKKCKDLQRERKNEKRRNDRLQEKVSSLVKQDGVSLDDKLDEVLTEALRQNKLTPFQHLLFQQQLSNKKGFKGNSWHPALIRFALFLKSNTGTSGYEDICHFITLPGVRTLYDYEHFSKAEEGVSMDALQSLSNGLKDKKPYQSYHVLMFDEMQISKNLVYQKSTGDLIGYVKLSDAERDLNALEKYVENEKRQDGNEPPMATKILTFMVKGVATNVKEAVASYTVSNLSKCELFRRAWHVVGCLERAGVRVIAMVGDGSPINRAFFQMHVPLHDKLPSGVVYSTLNMHADRPMFFISDPPHLLKTIRNCFQNSGRTGKSTRLLTINEQHIEWNTIVRLYKCDAEKTLRKSYKLGPQNVYLNSYSCMRVSYAAQVLSNTVSEDLKARNWPGTAETVKFIKLTNDWFDCLNGAHSSQAAKTANNLLAAYTSINDTRFEMLYSYLNYLQTWESQVKALPNLTADQKQKCLLSSQSRLGIEMTVNGFIGAVKYLLGPDVGMKFINARCFCQDPLEQYFGRIRQKLGGSRNPNVSQFFQSENAIRIHRQMAPKRRSGNTEVDASEDTAKIDNTPLSKRQRPPSLFKELSD